MSGGYDNSNKGILSLNTKREKDTHPEYSGTINVAGIDYWLSGWIKERKDGSGKFFSLSVKVKKGQERAITAEKFRESATKAFGKELDDGIPF